jgi:Virulence-associated protein E/Primase C terminal 2 (PriCT-2)/Bifunctional DNA primase/polymerase, N-terminal
MTTLHAIATPATFTATRLQIYRNGYHPVPIIGAHIDTRSAGKRPGMSDWETICLTADEPEIKSWSRSQSNCTNTGILCGTVSGVDIDVLDPALSDRINARAIERLGPTPLIRVGRAPKTLLCYRLAGPIKKLSTPELFFTDDADDAKATKVEILGDGQQVVAFGIHPDTHKEYHWPDKSPLDTHADDIPLVTAEALAAFVVAAEQMIREAGGRTKAEIKAGTKSADADTKPFEAEGMSAKIVAAHDAVRSQNRVAYEKPSRELIVSALAAVPNDLDYDRWIKMGYALRDGLGVDGLDVWQAFSETYPGNSTEVTTDKWKSFANGRSATIATLFWWARKNGWRHTGTEWTANLKANAQGAPKALLANAVIALRQSPDWIGSLAHNAFTLETSLDAPPPWHTELSPAASRDDDDKQTDWAPRVWGPYDDLCLTDWMQHQEIAISPNQAAQAVEMVAKDRIVHPVLDYLAGLKHDGTVRTDVWLIKFLGAEDTAYHRSVGRAMLIAAVARIRDPGCKVDTVPILEGPQGALKSTAIGKLFDPWFTDELADLGSKDAAMQMSGIWGVELAELDAMSRTEVSRTKAFISRKIDRFRPPYGQRLVERRRACVFWGTTNAEGYLKDETGGRRFWPIKVGKIDLLGLAANRDQLWAEAQALYDAGLPWWISNQDIQVAAEEQQRDRYQGDVWDGEIADYVTRMGDRDITIVEVLKELDVPIERCGQVEMNRVARSLRMLGLFRRQRGSGAAKRWVYSNPAATRTGQASADIVPLRATGGPRF